MGGQALTALEARYGLGLSSLELLGRLPAADHFASVQSRFLDHLEPDELAVLGRVFGRFAPRAAEACDADRGS